MNTSTHEDCPADASNLFRNVQPSDTRAQAAFLRSLKLPEPGVEYVLNVLCAPPDRKVGRVRKRNMILDVAMQRHRVALQAESLSGEFLFLLDIDHRTDVQAVLDQPIATPLWIVDRRGHGRPVLYTADYLVIYDSEVVAYEIKSDVELQRLVAERPVDWRVNGDEYTYRPAVEAFGRLGIAHRSIPTSSLNSIRGDNLRLLASVRANTPTRPGSRVERKIQKIVEAEGFIRIDEILDRLEIPDATPVLCLIDKGLIHADLDRCLLSNPTTVWVSSSPDGARSAHAAGRDLNEALQQMGDAIDGRLPGAKYITELAFRISYLTGNSADVATSQVLPRKPPSKRTLRRWRRAFEEANEDPAALEPGWQRCGNRDTRRSQFHEAYIAAHIACACRNPSFQSIKQWHGEYLNDFKKAAAELEFSHEHSVSLPTFYERWHARGLAEGAAERGGRRLQNALANSFDPRTKTILATRSFAVAHIDHCLCKIAVIVGIIDGKVITQRPWLSAMVDAFTGEILAIWIGFSPPSRKACTLVIRDCVRRHGRLPEMVITDGGPDFRSAHFSVMLAILNVTRAERPPEDPRFGKEVERAFGAFKERFLRGLPGFGIGIAKSRKLSAGFKAGARAKFSPVDLLECFEAFIFHGYNTVPRGDATTAPIDLRIGGLQSLPCCGRPTAWNLKFLVASSIEAPESAYKLWPGRGVEVYEQWYWSDRLLAYFGTKREIALRIEPFDDSVIYACVDGRWFACYSTKRKVNSATMRELVLTETTVRYDFRALIAQLKRETDMRIAELIRATTSKVLAANENASVASDVSDSASTHLPICFDDLQVLSEDARVKT